MTTPPLRFDPAVSAAVPVAQIRVLHVEDDPVQQAIVHRLLVSAGEHFRQRAVRTLAEAQNALASGAWDVCLLDLCLPDSIGLGTLRRVLAVRSQTPVVVLTGADDPWLALAAIKGGAQDFLIKGHMDVAGLGRALTFAVARKQRNGQMAPAPDNGFEAGGVFDSIPVAIAIVDDRLRLCHANRAWFVATGSPSDTLDGTPLTWLRQVEDQASIEFSGNGKRRRMRVLRSHVVALPGREAVCLMPDGHAR